MTNENIDTVSEQIARHLILRRVMYHLVEDNDAYEMVSIIKASNFMAMDNNTSTIAYNVCLAIQALMVP
jgi:hypothetical protein